MEKEFIPYTLALEMKSIGFDEPCFAFRKDPDMIFIAEYNQPAPTFSQAFRWFRKKYGYWSYIKEATKGTCRFYIEKFDEKFFNSDIIDSYEEAELECLKKLIEIVKK
jgi:hypothetical protein